jgi:hypothetical protein
LRRGLVLLLALALVLLLTLLLLLLLWRGVARGGLGGADVIGLAGRDRYLGRSLIADRGVITCSVIRVIRINHGIWFVRFRRLIRLTFRRRRRCEVLRVLGLVFLKLILRLPRRGGD